MRNTLGSYQDKDCRVLLLWYIVVCGDMAYGRGRKEQWWRGEAARWLVSVGWCFGWEGCADFVLRVCKFGGGGR